MALKGKIYSIARQHDDLNTNELFQSMIDKSAAQDTIVMDGRNIAAGSIFAEQIHANAITADHIKSGAIETDHMDAGTIDVSVLKSSQLILPGANYGGVVINNNGISMKSTGTAKLDIKLSSASGFNITDRFNNQLIDINPSTGNVKMQVNEMTIGGYSAATTESVKGAIDDIEVGGRNLIVDSTRRRNRVLTTSDPNGASSGAGNFISDYIDVRNLSEITGSMSDDSQPQRVLFIDENGDGFGYSMTWDLVHTWKVPTEAVSVLYTASERVDNRYKLEKGNKATDWTPAPEDVEDSYTAVAEAKANLAKTEAKAYADDVVDDEEERAIQDAKDKLEEAKKHANSQAGDAETRAKTHADGKAETAETNAKDYAKKQVDDIEIGGRNLVLNSSVLETSALGAVSGSRAEYQTIRTGESYMDLEDGEIITISFDIEMKIATKNLALQVYNSNRPGPVGIPNVSVGSQLQGTVGETINKRISFTTYAITRDTPSYSYNTLEFYSNYGSDNFYKISKLKVERGNKATDWTPAPEDVQAEIDSRPTFDDFDQTDKVTINGGNIKAGTISSENNYSWIDLDKGHFSFGNRRLVWDGSEMTVNGKISVNNIDGDIPKSKLESSVQTEINAGSAAKSTLDSKSSTWDAKETTGGAQAKATAAETAAKTHAELKDSVISMDGKSKKFSNTASFDPGGSSYTGYLIIRTPITSAFMTKLKISGYNYRGGSSNLDLDVGFYAYTSTSFVNYDFVSRGSFAISEVRLGRDSAGRAVVILGKSNTSYSYPKISVDEAIIGHGTPPDSYKDGWSISISNSLSGISNVVSVSGVDTQSNLSETKGKTDKWTHPGTTLIGGDFIQTGTMDANRIKANTITANQIAADAITAEKIAADAITAEKIAANAITIGKMPTADKDTINDASTNAADAINRVGAVEDNINNAVTTIDGTGVTVKDGSFFLEDDVSSHKYSIVSLPNLIKDPTFSSVKNVGRYENPYYNLGEIDEYNTYYYITGDPYTKTSEMSYGQYWFPSGTPLMYTDVQYMSGYTSPSVDRIDRSRAQFEGGAVIVSSGNTVGQDIFEIKPNATYTISAFVKTFDIEKATRPAVEVFSEHFGIISGSVTASGVRITFATNPNRTGDYQRVSATFKTTSMLKEYVGVRDHGDITVYLTSNNSNKMIFERIQLVESSYPTQFVSDADYVKLVSGQEVSDLHATRLIGGNIHAMYSMNIGAGSRYEMDWQSGFGGIREKLTLARTDGSGDIIMGEVDTGGTGMAGHRIITKPRLHASGGLQFIMISIPSGANLNNYTTAGFYYCTANVTAKTLVNRAHDQAFSLVVYRHAGTKQIWYHYNTNAAWTRRYYNGNWSSWVKIQS